MISSGSRRTRDLTTDDLEPAFHVRSRPFRPLNPSMRDWWSTIQIEAINEHRAIGVFEGERLLAHATVRSYQQFWGGRQTPMSGVAGVVVAPDVRGRGVGSQLMAAPTGSPGCMPGLPFISCAQPDLPRVAARQRTNSSTQPSPAGRHTCWSTSRTTASQSVDDGS